MPQDLSLTPVPAGHGASMWGYLCPLLLLLSCSVISSFFVTPWTVARQAPLSMGFPRQEHWRGLPFPPPGDLPGPGNETASPALQADSLPPSPGGAPVSCRSGISGSDRKLADYLKKEFVKGWGLYMGGTSSYFVLFLDICYFLN